jgi:hypothetical protein
VAVTIGGRRRAARPPAAELFAELVRLVEPLPPLERMQFAAAIGEGVAWEDLAPELQELLQELATWAARRLVP